jgi:hypothetical protein
MNDKKRKILDVSATPNYFNLDIRISIPRSQISEEMVNDILSVKDDLINGNGNQIYHAKITSGEDGRDLLEIGTSHYYGE